MKTKLTKAFWGMIIMIRLGNENKIKNSVVGNNNQIREKKENQLLTIVITIITGVIVGGIIYLLGWN